LRRGRKVTRDVKLFAPCITHAVASADDETVIL
jgi:hypothetical protein